MRNKILTVITAPIIVVLLLIGVARAHHGEGEGKTQCRETETSPWAVSWKVTSQHWKDYWRLEFPGAPGTITDWQPWNEDFEFDIQYPANQVSADLSNVTGRWDDTPNFNGSVTGGMQIPSVARPGVCPAPTTTTTTTTTTTIPPTTTTTTTESPTTTTTTLPPETTTTTTTLPPDTTVSEDTTTIPTTIATEITEPPVPSTQVTTVPDSTLPVGTPAPPPTPTAAPISVVPVEELPATGSTTNVLLFIAATISVIGIALSAVRWKAVK